MDPVELRLSRAYTTLILQQPFIATGLLRLQKVEDNTQPTAWTDGRYLGYNKEFILSLTPNQLVGLLAHEVFHVYGLHMLRMEDRKLFPWNVACDGVVNALCHDLKLDLPPGGVPPQPGKSAEELYHDLPSRMKSSTQSSGWGEVRPATGPNGEALSPAEISEMEEEVKITIRQAVEAAKAAGKLPAALKRWVDGTLEPRVPWREILAQFISSHAKTDFSWSQPNRRYLSSGIMMPSLYSPTYGEVVMACDTSGSINQRELKEICSEVLGCLSLYASEGQVPELTVAWFDTRVYAQTVSDESELDPKGGGGTDYAPVFDWMRKEDVKPKAVIFVTDGQCSSFGTPVDEVPVLWILTSPLSSFKPPFGTIAATINK